MAASRYLSDYILQKRFRKNFHSSSFLPRFRPFPASSVPIFCTEKCSPACRKALLAFPKRGFLWFSIPRFGPQRPPFSCLKGLPGLQRDRFRTATGLSLQCRKDPAATPGGPYGKSISTSREYRGTVCICNLLWMSMLRNLWIFVPEKPWFLIRSCLQYSEPPPSFSRKWLFSWGLNSEF